MQPIIFLKAIKMMTSIKLKARHTPGIKKNKSSALRVKSAYPEDPHKDYIDLNPI